MLRVNHSILVTCWWIPLCTLYLCLDNEHIHSEASGVFSELTTLAIASESHLVPFKQDRQCRSLERWFLCFENNQIIKLSCWILSGGGVGWGGVGVVFTTHRSTCWWCSSGSGSRQRPETELQSGGETIVKNLQLHTLAALKISLLSS